MAKAKQREQAQAVELEPEVIAAVVLADLAQIEADAETHPDSNAQNRIRRCVARLRAVAQGEMPETEQ